MSNLICISKEEWLPLSADKLRHFMRLDEGETDAVLEEYIQAATDLFEQETHYLIRKARFTVTYNMYHNNKKMRYIVYRLPHRPILNIQNVFQDHYLIPQEEYIFDCDVVVPLKEPVQTLAITYEAGYETADNIPPSLKHLLMMAAADLYLYRVSEAGGYSFSKKILSFIQRYKRKGI